MTNDYKNFATLKNQMTDEEYKKLWQSCGPIKVRMIEKIGKCKHNLNDTFYYKTPYEKPEGICPALLHVLDLYTWRAVFGFPSWEPDDRHVYKIHCPAKKGTVWEMCKVDKAE